MGRVADRAHHRRDERRARATGFRFTFADDAASVGQAEVAVVAGREHRRVDAELAQVGHEVGHEAACVVASVARIGGREMHDPQRPPRVGRGRQS